jgi:hypothetical protein
VLRGHNYDSSATAMQKRCKMETIEEFNKEIDQRFEALTEKNESVRDLVSSINVDKIENIKQVIEEINELILERTELSKSLILSYETLLSRINNIMGRITPEFIKEEISLHDKAIQVEEAKIKEKLDCWRDIALLKRELRERLHDFRAEENKKDAYSSLLG